MTRQVNKLGTMRGVGSRCCRAVEFIL